MPILWEKLGNGPDEYTIDHFIPIEKGGGSEESNLVLSCSTCDSKKTTSTPSEFISRHPEYSDAVERVRTFLDAVSRVSETLQDKDKDIDKDKDKDILTVGNFQNVKLSRKDFDTLTAEYGEKKRIEIIDKLSAYKKSKGKVYKSDIGAIRQWVLEAVKAVKLSEKPRPVEVSGRSDAWTPEKQAEFSKDLEDKAPLTEAEIAELEAMKIKAFGTGSGRLLAAVLRGGRTDATVNVHDGPRIDSNPESG